MTSKFKVYIKSKNLYLSVSKLYMDNYNKVTKIEAEGRILTITGNENLYKLFVRVGEKTYTEMELQ